MGIARSEPPIDKSGASVWNSLAAVIAGSREIIDVSNPRACLRRETSRPRILEPDYFAAVATVVRSHSRRARPSLDAGMSLAGGRLLVYWPDLELADGASEDVSRGYFDVNDAPPWDTWIAMVADDSDPEHPYLLAWCPPEFLELAQKGMNANAVECIRWLDDTSVAMRAICRALKAG